jgi:hypothetical protein
MNIGRETDCLAWGFLSAPPPPQANSRAVPKITPRPLASTSSSIHYPPIILPFHTAQAYSELWKASSRKYKRREMHTEFFIGKSEVQRSLRIPERRWKNNIKMDLKERGF